LESYAGNNAINDIADYLGLLAYERENAEMATLEAPL
jgi:hypothetical protein